MKAFIRIIFAVLVLAVLASPPALALGETTYRIDAPGMAVSIPDTMVVLTRNVAPDDPILALLGLDMETLESYFEEDGGVLLAISMNSAFMLQIYTDFNSLSMTRRDFCRYTDAELAEDLNSINTAFREQGIMGMSVDLYDQKQTKFELIDYTDPETESGHLQAYTIADLREIHLVFSDFGNQTIEGERDTCMQIIDSISFDAYDNESHARFYAEIQKKDSDAALTPGNQSEESLFSSKTLTLIALGFFMLILVIKARKRREAAKEAEFRFGRAPDEGYERKPELPIRQLPPDAVRCPECGAVNKTDRDTCYRCGKTLNEGPEGGKNDEHDGEDGNRL